MGLELLLVYYTLPITNIMSPFEELELVKELGLAEIAALGINFGDSKAISVSLIAGKY